MKNLLLTISMALFCCVVNGQNFQKVTIGEMYYLFKNYEYKALNDMMLKKGFSKMGQVEVFNSINNTYYLPPKNDEVFYSKYVEEEKNLSFEYRIHNANNNLYQYFINDINKIGFVFSKQTMYDNELMDLYKSKDDNFVIFTVYTFNDMKILFISTKEK